MELQINIGIKQILGLIKQLPRDQKLLIKRELDQEVILDKTHVNEEDLTELLLRGPIMSNEEEINFKKFNKEFDKWTKTLFA